MVMFLLGAVCGGAAVAVLIGTIHMAIRDMEKKWDGDDS